MKETDLLVWALNLLEANGGGVQKSYFRDKCIALGDMSHTGFYRFMSNIRGHDWVKENAHKDGSVWVILTPEGTEQLQALRTASS